MLVFLAKFFVLTSQHAANCLILGSSGLKSLCNDAVLLICGPYVDYVDHVDHQLNQHCEGGVYEHRESYVNHSKNRSVFYMK